MALLDCKRIVREFPLIQTLHFGGDTRVAQIREVTGLQQVD
jgi:hypothetical protein